MPIAPWCGTGTGRSCVSVTTGTGCALGHERARPQKYRHWTGCEILALSEFTNSPSPHSAGGFRRPTRNSSQQFFLQCALCLILRHAEDLLSKLHHWLAERATMSTCSDNFSISTFWIGGDGLSLVSAELPFSPCTLCKRLCASWHVHVLDWHGHAQVPVMFWICSNSNRCLCLGFSQLGVFGMFTTDKLPVSQQSMCLTTISHQRNAIGIKNERGSYVTVRDSISLCVEVQRSLRSAWAVIQHPSLYLAASTEATFDLTCTSQSSSYTLPRLTNVVILPILRSAQLTSAPRRFSKMILRPRSTISASSRIPSDCTTHHSHIWPGANFLTQVTRDHGRVGTSSCARPNGHPRVDITTKSPSVRRVSSPPCGTTSP